MAAKVGTKYKQENDHFGPKIVSMIRKYHNHKLQTNPWYHEEEPLETFDREINIELMQPNPL